MKNITRFLSVLMLLALSFNLYAQDYAMAAPIGYGASATGGTGGTVVTVTDRAGLDSQLNSSGKKIILVNGTINFASGQMIKRKVIDKTLIGLPGAKLVSNAQVANGGILELSEGSKNVIIRNLIFEGPGAYDTDGNDLLFNRGTQVWVDHCEFYDGVDGNFDNSNGADNVTISWCKFGYNKPAKAGGSGGSDDHRFSNLVGGSDTTFPSDGRYSITFMYCWWTNGAKERMPRARNAQLHLLNNYVNTNVSGSLAIGLSAGSKGTDCYVENCHFEKVGTVQKSNYGGSPKLTIVGCDRGNTTVGGGAARPTYTYTALPYTSVKAAVTGACGAGATLQVNATTGAVSSGCNASEPTIALTTGAVTAAQTVQQGSALQSISYQYGGTATGFSITYSGAATSKPSWLTETRNGNTLTFSGTPTGYAANTTLTIKVKATTGGAATSEELTATINITVPAPATLVLTSGNTNQTAYLNTSITNIVYTYGGGATGANVTGLPAGVTASVDNTAKTVTVSGTPTATGTFNYTVTTVGGQGSNPSENGRITVNAPNILGAPVATYSVSGSAATVNWQAVAGASSYNVRWCSATGSSGTTNKNWDFNATAYTVGSISTTTIDGATFISGGSLYSFTAGKAKTYSDGFAGGDKVLQTGGASTYANGIPTKRFMSFSVDGPVKVTAWFFGNSTGDRSIIFSAGTAETEEDFPSSNQSAVIASYNYTGGAGTIYVYSDASINISRIKVEPTAASSCNERNVTGTSTVINPFDTFNGTIFVQAVSNSAGYITGEYAQATAQNVAVNATLTLTSAPATTAQNITTGSDLAGITYSYTGTPTIIWTGTANATTAPEGVIVNISANTIAITGTPTTIGNFGYTVLAAGINGGTNATSLNGTINVTLAPVNAILTLRSANADATVTAGNLVDIDYDYTGATPVIVWTGTANASTAPAGITVESGVDYISISGIPTTAGTYGYTINVAGLNGGSAATPASGTINVNAALTVPANIQAIPAQTSIGFTWNAVPGATKYIVNLCHNEETAGTGGGSGSDTPVDIPASASTTTPYSADGGNITLDIEGTNVEGLISSGSSYMWRMNQSPAYLVVEAKNGKYISKVEVVVMGNNNTAGNYGIGAMSIDGFAWIAGQEFELPLSNASPATVTFTAPDEQNVTHFKVGRAGTGTSLGGVSLTKGGATVRIYSVKVWYKSTGGTTIQEVCDTYETITNSITIPNLAPDTPYTYQVKAVRGTEESAYSTAATTATLTVSNSINDVKKAEYIIYRQADNLIVKGDEVQSLEVYNLIGVSIAKNEKQNEINLSSAPSGVYIVNINQGNGKKFVWK